MNKTVTESQFYMWRTLFAVSHADNIVTEEEMRFMIEALEDLPFSSEQREILSDDIVNPKDIVEMFGKISNNRDQAAFLILPVSWSGSMAITAKKNKRLCSN